MKKSKKKPSAKDKQQTSISTAAKKLKLCVCARVDQ